HPARPPRGGGGPVPPPPFATHGAQNLEALTTRVTAVLETGVAGILCLGATGEALALSDEEREAQIRAVVDAAGDRARVVVGCMDYTPERMSRHNANANTAGADEDRISNQFFSWIDTSVAAVH